MKKTLLIGAMAGLILTGAGCKSVEEKPAGDKEMTEAETSSAMEKEYISAAEAVDAVKNSNTMQNLVADFPNFLDGVRFYTKEVSRLGDNDLGMLVNSTTEVFYRANSDKKVWQVLLVCRLDRCDLGYFLRALNAYSPALPEEGIKNTYGDLYFAVNAESGEIIMFERGNELLETGDWALFNE